MKALVSLGLWLGAAAATVAAPASGAAPAAPVSGGAPAPVFLDAGKVRAAAARIDALLAADWKANGLKPNPPASDAVIVRRLYLDLAGRIPTSAEAQAFLDDPRKDKRARLVADLLGRESYVQNFFNMWADVLRYKSSTNNTASVVEAAYGKFIKDSLRTNKPYDQFVRELVAAKGYAWDNGAIGFYHRDPGMPLDNMAITGRIFLGTRMECAQCHDHPFEDWKQTQFYQMAAFTHAYSDPASPLQPFRAEMNRRVEEIDADFRRERAADKERAKEAQERKNARIEALDNRGLTNVIKSTVGQLLSPVELQRKVDKPLKLPADFKEPDGKPGDVIKPCTVLGEQVTPAAGEDPAEVLARWLTSPGNPRFAKVATNRLWARLFGVPVIEGFDDLKDDSAPMVAGLDGCLEEIFVGLGYDMKAFLAVLANTRAYQSQALREEFTRGAVCHFQGPQLRRMSAEQVWDSLVVLANHEPEALNQSRSAAEERRIQVSRMACDALLAFDGKKLMEIAQARVAEDAELVREDAEVKAALAAAKRANDAAKVKELSQQEGRIAATRAQRSIDQIITPMLENLATQRGGVLSEDPSFKPSGNPRVLEPEAWRKVHLTGYGPPPPSAEELAARAAADKQAGIELAIRLGIPEAQRSGFLSYRERAMREWLRAAELDSPAPRGHLLRIMGQSDRDFVDNGSAAASIPQALALMNSDLISPKGLLSPFSPLMLAVKSSPNPHDQVDAAYLALFARKATTSEHATWEQAAANGLTSVEDLLYALLNTRQFLFVQ